MTLWRALGRSLAIVGTVLAAVTALICGGIVIGWLLAERHYGLAVVGLLGGFGVLISLITIDQMKLDD